MTWGHYDDVSWWWLVAMPLVMLGFWAAVIRVIVTVVGRDTPDHGGGRDTTAG